MPINFEFFEDTSQILCSKILNTSCFVIILSTCYQDHLCFSHAFVSVHCCLVVTCWERADPLALVGDVYCVFVTFRCGT